MLRTFGDARGLRKVMVGLLTGIAVLAIAVDAADAKRRRHKRVRSSYNPPYAAIVVDANSGDVLHSSAADAERHPASLTKIMTLYLLFEGLQAGKFKLDTELKVSEHASEQSPTKLGLKEGQTIKVEDAILGLVTRSANDAAVVIAEAIAGDEEDFAKLMTRKARALGMNHTVYKNASGLPNSDQVTTARDQARLGRAIQDRFPKYYKYFSRRSFTFRGNSIRNHNRLLGSVPGVDGIKTGFIRASGYNLVASMKHEDRYLVAVVLGGKSGGARDARMRSLLETYAKRASTKRTTPLIAEAPVADNEPIAVATADNTPATVTAAPAKPISSTTVRASAYRRDPATTATVSVAKVSGDPIKPIAVKTIKVKLDGAKTASLTPPLSRVPVVTALKAEQTMQPAPDSAAAAAPPAARSSVPAGIQVASAGPDSIPVTAVKAVAPAPAPAANEPTSEPVASEPAPRKRSGWMIQVGAFEAERDAKDRLSSARSKAKHLLGAADPFTETVVKDEKTFYRARFAGFDKGEAVAACKYLKRKDFACMTLKN
ncbi:MAG: D-alanyl-D-alanine carboxypeptidase [Xanthobacteraceae bacterium]